MSQQPDRSAFVSTADASASASGRASPRVTRHDGWSLAKQAAFLRQLSATHSVSAAAKSVGMSRQSAYRLRSRLKGQAFDLAWEVAFHHSYDVLAHAALERALNGTEVPVFFQGEQVGSYRRYDERLTVAMLRMMTVGGNPALGRLGPGAERHARDFEALLGALERGEPVAAQAPGPEDPSEIEELRARGPAKVTFLPSAPCPSALDDDELCQHLQNFDAEIGK
jgi:hypothetical protein